MDSPSYVLEESYGGLSLVVTGPWSESIHRTLLDRRPSRLVLNSARGFSAVSLDFIRDWPVRQLEVIDLGQTDGSPILRLAKTLETLSIELAPQAVSVDLGALGVLRSLAGPWRAFAPSISRASALTNLVTWQYRETDLIALSANRLLEAVTVKDAPKLLSLRGVAGLQNLRELRIELARNLGDIDGVAELAHSLRVLGLVKCPSLRSIDAVSGLRELRQVEFGDCGLIESLWPLAGLRHLESVYAWGRAARGGGEAARGAVAVGPGDGRKPGDLEGLGRPAPSRGVVSGGVRGETCAGVAITRAVSATIGV